jgi:signal transduction histidine kinase
MTSRHRQGGPLVKDGLIRNSSAINLTGGWFNRGVDGCELIAGYGEHVRLWSCLHRSRIRESMSVAVVPAALLAVASVELLANPRVPHPIVAGACTLLMIVSLVARRSAPIAVTLLVGGSFVTQTALGVPVNAQVATLLVIGVTAFAVGRNVHGVRSWCGLGVVLVIVMLSSVISGSAPGDVAVAAMLFVASWLAGISLARRAQEARHLTDRVAFVEATADDRAIAAVDLERRRIARELHDVIAHAITVMVLQAGAAEAVLTPCGDSRALEALRVVQDAGRSALIDMKHLLGMLRATGEDVSLVPAASLADLAALVAQLNATGLVVSLHTDGDLAGCPPGVASSAYQVVREALINTLRHAGATHANVTVHCDASLVDLEVSDDGHGRHDTTPGFGLIGMRERVAAFGGEFDAGTRACGGFAVHARIPLLGGSTR